jgi:DNA-directed RNA polymerase subunit RPC12/RpoP
LFLGLPGFARLGQKGRIAMQAEYKCPFCRAEIAPEDVNVATDVALCRSCGRTISFSIISGSAGISRDILLRPPRGIRVDHDAKGGTVITYRKLSSSLLFLIPFTAFWSGMSMWGIYGRQISKGHFDLNESLSGLPFLIGTIVLLGIIIFLLFGKWTITLWNGKGSVVAGVGSLA